MGIESVDLIATWQNLYVMLGTSSAALIGLLFVATLLHLGEIVSSPVFRVRAYNQSKGKRQKAKSKRQRADLCLLLAQSGHY
jgi:hypothetical protein